MYNPERTTVRTRTDHHHAGGLARLDLLPPAGRSAVLGFRPRRLAGGGVKLSPVTFLEPYTGIDPRLLQNLESFFRLDYPRFEDFLFEPAPATTRSRHRSPD